MAALHPIIAAQPQPPLLRSRFLSNLVPMFCGAGGRAGGSITAALFLKEYVKEGVEWAHLDIAGPVRALG